jgi:hypothetical protein
LKIQKTHSPTPCTPGYERTTNETVTAKWRNTEAKLTEHGLRGEKVEEKRGKVGKERE